MEQYSTSARRDVGRVSSSTRETLASSNGPHITVRKNAASEISRIDTDVCLRPQLRQNLSGRPPPDEAHDDDDSESDFKGPRSGSVVASTELGS